jgi:hypothetical protein
MTTTSLVRRTSRSACVAANQFQSHPPNWQVNRVRHPGLTYRFDPGWPRATGQQSGLAQASMAVSTKSVRRNSPETWTPDAYSILTIV